MRKIIDMKVKYSRSIPATWRRMSRVFEALGDEQRQRILLSFEPGERLNVGQIADGSTLARSTVSHHLRIMHEAGVLQREKIGKEVYFWVNKAFLQDTIANVANYLRDSL